MADNTPSEDAVAAAARTFDVTDPVNGKVITIRKPGVLAQFDFLEMLGPVRAVNAAYVQMSMPVMCVVAIDGIAVPQPAKYSEFRALIQRLDDSGIAAIALGVEKHFGQQQTPEEAKSAIKK